MHCARSILIVIVVPRRAAAPGPFFRTGSAATHRASVEIRVGKTSTLAFCRHVRERDCNTWASACGRQEIPRYSRLARQVQFLGLSGNSFKSAEWENGCYQLKRSLRGAGWGLLDSDTWARAS